jgi:hypothetical protein
MHLGQFFHIGLLDTYNVSKADLVREVGGFSVNASGCTYVECEALYQPLSGSSAAVPILVTHVGLLDARVALNFIPPY